MAKINIMASAQEKKEKWAHTMNGIFSTWCDIPRSPGVRMRPRILALALITTAFTTVARTGAEEVSCQLRQPSNRPW